MTINTEIVKKYKVVHTWTGIVSSIVLFVAFYAGALAIFKPEITAWTQASIQQPAGSGDIDALAQAYFSEGAGLAGKPTLVLPSGSDATARIYFTDQGVHRAAYLDHEGRMHTPEAPAAGTELRSGRTSGDFVDDVHRAGGLPLDVETAEPIIGVVSLVYAIALVSGVIALLPSLIKDLFLLRITHNVKRMWLDVHNVLGITSLPFHVVMALTAAVFGLHHFIFDAQSVAIYPQGLEAYEARSALKSEPAPSAVPPAQLPPSQLLAKVNEITPDFVPTTVRYMLPWKGEQAAKVRIDGTDHRYFLRAGRTGLVMLDLSTGQAINTTYLPGKQTAMATTMTSFFGLHFGNFGGLPVRILYVVLGIMGALLFYSGNLLWIESRLKKSRQGEPPAAQPRHVHWLASLTVGACLGCVAGLSGSILAVRWLAGLTLAPDVVASYAYHGVFLAYVVLAFACGAARTTAPLLGVAAIITALIPLTSLVESGYGIASVPYLPAYVSVDVFFTVIAGLLFYLAHRARRRYLAGPRIFPKHRSSASVPEGALAPRTSVS